LFCFRKPRGEAVDKNSNGRHSEPLVCYRELYRPVTTGRTHAHHQSQVVSVYGFHRRRPSRKATASALSRITTTVIVRSLWNIANALPNLSSGFRIPTVYNCPVFVFRFILLPGILISNTGPKKTRNIECSRPSGQLTPIELRKVSFSGWILSITSQSGNYKHAILGFLKFWLNGIWTSG